MVKGIKFNCITIFPHCLFKVSIFGCPISLTCKLSAPGYVGLINSGLRREEGGREGGREGGEGVREGESEGVREGGREGGRGERE